jgi:hypothetical protein
MNEFNAQAIKLPRKPHSLQYKLHCLDYYHHHQNNITLTLAAKQLHIHKSMLCRWLKQEDQLRQFHRDHSLAQCRARFKLCDRPTSGKYPQQEQDLYRWIQEQRSQYFPVTYTDAQEKMRALTDNQCKASHQWLYGFMNRYQLSRRKMTSGARHLTSEDIQKRIENFKEFMDQKNGDCNNEIWNMDQTAVWLNAQHLEHTLNKKGAFQVPIQKNPMNFNPREKISVILACSSMGKKLPPAIIVKSGGSRPRMTLLNGVLVFHQPGTSMANQDIMCKWIEIYMGNIKDACSPFG